ncbi:MAG: hypothetical protein JNL02_11590 [Saprospiraceae bacterium]|nr:hypothetical protein [Saprospiraceae bacterium]
MKKIIALQGKGNSGKSSTIRALAELLIQKGARPIKGVNFPEVVIGKTGKPRDFWQVFDWNGTQIGITSAGDTYKIIKDRLDDLEVNNSQICVCACRTFDRKSKKGTIAAIQERTSYEVQFIKKTVDKNPLTQLSTNLGDAIALLNHLEN